jgi:hypothetical protein
MTLERKTPSLASRAVQSFVCVAAYVVASDGLRARSLTVLMCLVASPASVPSAWAVNHNFELQSGDYANAAYAASSGFKSVQTLR